MLAKTQAWHPALAQGTSFGPSTRIAIQEIGMTHHLDGPFHRVRQPRSFWFTMPSWSTYQMVGSAAVTIPTTTTGPCRRAAGAESPRARPLDRPSASFSQGEKVSQGGGRGTWPQPPREDIAAPEDVELFESRGTDIYATADIFAGRRVPQVADLW
jgi:hypothetical protein